MRYKKEHSVSTIIWLAVNIVLLVLILIKPSNSKPALVLAKNIEETTILKQMAAEERNSDKDSRGSLPSLQMSYPSKNEVSDVIKYFQMTPVILDSKSNIVYLVDLNKNSLVRIKNVSSLKKFSARARRVPMDILADFVNAAAKSLNVSAGKLDIVVLVPNSVEKFFLDLERKALAMNNISPGDVNLIKGRYERASGGYGVVLTEAVCKDGNVKELSEG